MGYFLRTWMKINFLESHLTAIHPFKIDLLVNIFLKSNKRFKLVRKNREIIKDYSNDEFFRFTKMDRKLTERLLENFKQ